VFSDSIFQGICPREFHESRLGKSLVTTHKSLPNLTCAYILRMLNQTPRVLFPPITPFHHGLLPEEDGHTIYFEECGNPQGVPVIFLHGGPGSGCSPKHRQFFDPKICRAVLFDQRGCGRSAAEHLLFKNDTAHLIHDMERLRKHLNIDKWLVVGGSWGGGLALAYACQHPESFSGAVLRNTFLCRPSDLKWFFQDAQQFMPDAWEKLVEHIPDKFHDNICQYLCAHILEADKETALKLAQSWNTWENALLQRSFAGATATPSIPHDADKLIDKYKIQSHYLQNLCFFPEEGLLPHLSRITHTKIELLQGRLDWVCRPESSWDIHHKIPHSRLQWVESAGHGIFETPMVDCMVSTIHSCVASLQKTKSN